MSNEQKIIELKSIIHEVIWQYCYGKGDTDALFNFQDIGKATDEIVEQYFQPESQSEKSEPGKTAEEIADKYSHYGISYIGEYCFVIEYSDAIKAMEEYARQFSGQSVKKTGEFRVKEIKKDCEYLVEKSIDGKNYIPVAVTDNPSITVNKDGNLIINTPPSDKVSVTDELLKRAYDLVGHPATNISSSCDMACDIWRKDYEAFIDTLNHLHKQE